jgi:hypothetical protein
LISYIWKPSLDKLGRQQEALDRLTVLKTPRGAGDKVRRGRCSWPICNAV